MRHRPRAARAGALLLGLLLSLGIPVRASAHGVLRRAVPAAGAHLAAAPREVRLTFNEPVELTGARLALRGPDGAPVALAPLRRGDARTVLVADIAGPLAAGGYVVEWQVVGRDGHPVRDTFRFTIAPGATGLAAADLPVPAGTRITDAPPAIDAHHDPVAMPSGAGLEASAPVVVAVRWFGFVAVLALIGTLGTGLLVLPAAPRQGGDPAALATARTRLRALGLAAAGALVVASAARLVVQSVALHGADAALEPDAVRDLVARTRWGAAWLLQVAGGLAAGAGLALLARHRRAGWTLAALGVTTVALAAALSGHAAAVAERTALFVAADALHVLAAGGWLGTLLVVAAVALPAARRAPPGARGPTAAALVRAFSPVALACATLVALTGALAAWHHLGGVSALATSSYGRALLVKLALLVPVLALGAYHWRRVTPLLASGDQAGPARLARSVAGELLFGALVLAATAVLVALPTPLDAAR